MNSIPFPRMHVSLYVKDIKKTVKFYTSFFGQEPEKVKVRYAKFMLEKPALVISFVEKEELVKPHFGHLGFQIDTKEHLLAHHQLIKEKGLQTLEEMGTQCCYALQDKYWVADPDGYRWEVYYFHEDVAWNDPEYSLEDTTDVVSRDVPIPKMASEAEITSLNQGTKISTCC